LDANKAKPSSGPEEGEQAATRGGPCYKEVQLVNPYFRRSEEEDATAE